MAAPDQPGSEPTNQLGNQPGNPNAPIVAQARRSGLSPALVLIGSVTIYFLSQLIAGFAILIYPTLHGWSQARSQDWLLNSTVAQFWLIVLVEVLTIFGVLKVLKWRQTKPSLIGLIKPKLFDIVRGLAGFIVYLPVYVGVYYLAQALIPTINYEQKQQLGFESASGSTQLFLVFISLVILPPLAEEFLVRGFLFTGLRSRLKFVGATILTSLIFAAAHLQFGSGAPLLWTAAMDTFILSLVLCYLRERSGSLWPGIFLHALKNGVAFVVLFAAR